MSGGAHRRRVPTSSPVRRRKLPSPSRRSDTPRRSTSRPDKVFKRCLSEPLLWDDRAAGGSTSTAAADPTQSYVGSDIGVLFRPQTCTDVFSSSPSLMGSGGSPLSSEAYNRDAKVVVNVTVEGSPGPVRTMVKLGSTVHQTIEMVMDKYGQEGRTPKLDRGSAANFELHHSYFSLQGLDKSELIGDIGSRSFYLRRGSSSRGSIDASSSKIAEPAAAKADVAVALPRIFLIPLPAFFARRFGKIFRRTRKLWRVVGCMQ